MSTFRKDLARERRNILYVQDLLLSLQTVAAIVEPEVPTKEYDFTVQFRGGEGWKCEVKEDFYCRRSNNVAIEFTSRGKPSGIVTTTADVWVIVAHQKDGKHVYCLKTVVLRWLIATKRYRKVHEDAGDRGSRTGIYLFPISIVQQFSLFLGAFDHADTP